MKDRRKLRAYAAVAGGFLLMAVLHTALHSSFSLFLLPVTESVGMPRSVFTLCTSIVALISLLLSPAMGRWMSGRALRPLFLICVAGFGVTYAAYGLARNALHFFLVSVVVGIFSCGATAIPVSIILTDWLPESSGTAVSIAYAGSGIGGAILTPILTNVISAQGWRSAFVFVAATMVAVALPSALFLLRPNPSAMRVRETNGRRGENPLWALLKKPYFLIFLLGIFLSCFVAFAQSSHNSPHLSGVYNEAYSALLISFMMLVQTPAKILLGRLYDKKGPRIATAFIMGCAVLSMAVYPFITDRILIWPAVALVAIGNCCGTVSPPVLTSSIFGTEHYGVIFGLVNTVLMLAKMIGPPLSALIYDACGSYRPAWLLCALFSLLSIFCFLYAHTQAQKDRASAASK